MQGKNPLQPRRGVEEMRYLLEEQLTSDLTVKQFCKEHHLSEAVFYYWRKKLKLNKSKAAPAGFRQIAIKVENNGLLGQLFAEYKGIRFYQEPSVSFLKQLIG